MRRKTPKVVNLAQQTTIRSPAVAEKADPTAYYALIITSTTKLSHVRSNANKMVT